MYKNIYLEKIRKKAKIASKDLSNLSIKKRNAVLKQFCIYLKTYSKLILKENKRDMVYAKKNKSNMIERLILDNKKIIQIIN